jgi:DNA polymerase III subunit delta
VDALDPVYIISSEHPILVDRMVASIRDAAVPEAMRAWNYDVVEGSLKASGSASRIVAIARTLPMMSAKRMVFIRDLVTLPADEAPVLTAYFADPNPSTVLVALTSKLDKRQKLYAAASKAGYLHVLEAPRQVAPWIRAEADARGVKLDPRAITRLAEAVGNDLSRLALVIEQLALYAGDGRAVTTDDVDDLVADTRERSVFELTDAVGAGDLPGAMAAVSALCDQRDSALGVVAMLARHMRQIGVVVAHRDKGGSKAQLASALGLPPFIADKVIAQARRYNADGLGRVTSLLAAADRALKGDQLIERPFTGFQMKTLGRDLGERVILERVVSAIVAEARA